MHRSPLAVAQRFPQETITRRIPPLAAFASIVLAAHSAAAAILDVPGTYPTIQAAIDAAVPGDSVVVAAGTYSENLTLGKRLALRGARVGVTGCGRVVAPPDPAIESVLTAPSGVILRLVGGSAQAVIDGFAFSGGTRGIESSGGPIDRLRIRNNHFSGQTGAAMFLNDDGIDIDVDRNEFDGVAGTGTLVHLDTDIFDGLRFTNNCVLNRATGAGLSVDGDHNVGLTTRLPRIVGNVFDGNEIGAHLGRFAFELGLITDNEFTNSGTDGLQGGIQWTTIRGNLFASNGGNGLTLTGFGGAADDTRGARSCTVIANTFTGNAGAGVSFSATQYPGTISTNVAIQNDFTGNTVGVTYAGTEEIDVTCNWWGDLGGPDAPPGNPNPPGEDISGSTFVYWPWLDGSIAGSPSCDQYGGNRVLPIADGDCISIANPCETVPVMFQRTDASAVRGISVTFELSAELVLCSTPAASIRAGTWLDSWSNRTFQVVDNGDRSYTVDQAILGELPTPCGAVTGGELFTVDVKASGVPFSGTITVTDVIVRDCVNGPVPGIPGPPASITIDTTAPAAVTNLAAVQVRDGNAIGRDTTGVTITFTPPPGLVTTEVWAAPYGNYPEYDDPPGAGSVPAVPTGYPPGPPWVLTTVTASAQRAYLEQRDFWYFVAYAKDLCGNVSATSNMTDGTLNYHLGDVTDGVTNGHGDNVVDGPDVSRLGAHYGITLAPSDSLNDLDVGPTTDFSPHGRPTTDDRIDFEDLMMFSVNFGHVSRAGATTPTEAHLGDPRLALVVDASGDRVLARLMLEEHGRTVQGAHASVTWDGASLELARVTQGVLLGTQDGPVFFGTIPGEGRIAVDLARLGSGATLVGAGEVAVLEFRRRGGTALPSLGEAVLRDVNNRPATRPAVPGEATEDPAVSAAVSVTEVELVGARPNPFGAATEIVFRIPSSMRASVRIHDVTGRLVRTLLDSSIEPGEHRVSWDGRSEDGVLVGSGIYFTTLRAGDVVQSRKLLYSR